MPLSGDDFWAPNDCHNCESMGRQPFDATSLKRCGRCKLMTYCNSDCQVEHWHRHHKKVCKYIAGEKEERVKIHPRFCGTMRLEMKDREHPDGYGYDEEMENYDCERCKNANRAGYKAIIDPESTALSCHTMCMQGSVKVQMLKTFRYKVNNPYDITATNPTPVNFPCVENENFMEPRYLHEGLSNLFILFENLKDKYEEALNNSGTLESVQKASSFIIHQLGAFWYHKMIGTSNKCIITMCGQSMYKAFHADTIESIFTKIDIHFHSNGVRYPWWGAILKYLNQFMQRLLWIDNNCRIDPRLINQERCPHLASLMSIIEPIYHGAFPLDLPFKKAGGVQLMSPIVVEALAEGSNCYSCKKNLSGQHGLWAFVSLSFYQKERGGLEFSDMEFMELVKIMGSTNHLMVQFQFGLEYIVFCSSKCMAKGKSEDKSIGDALIEDFNNTLHRPKLRICDFCEMFTDSIHRCSKCKARQYCKQKCLDDDWKTHTFVCKQFRDDPRRKVKKPMRANKVLNDENEVD